MIRVENLTKRYGSHCAVNNISFQVGKGEILGFLGPNGAGKSTTMNILTGYLSATDGTVTINGHDILDNPNAAKASIGYLPEIPPLYPDMTVKEYLNFMCDLKKCALPRQRHLAEICKVMKIEHVYNRLIKNLSKGYKQRVGVAQALLGNPDILILDEPTVGLDPKQIIDIRNLIKDLGKKHTVILSSHILPEIQAVCERVIVIKKGKLIADGTPADLSKMLSSNNRVVARIHGDEDQARKVIEAMPNVNEVMPLGVKEDGAYEFEIVPAEGVDIRGDLFNAISAAGMQIIGLKGSEMNLEDIFLQLVNDDASASYVAEEETENKPKKKWWGGKK